jgi:8-amino-7-oxononanoate synthase
MSDLLNWIPAELQTLVDGGLFRRRREVRSLLDGRCLVDGHEVWDFASNDYLGLASDPRVIAAATLALATHGVGAKASPLVSGRTDLHVRLEQELADFEGTEAAILFPTGMAANVGTVTSLASTDDVVFSDRLNHASLIDGCRLSGARLKIFRHDDLAGLDHALARESGRRKFIVTDSVFSMDGDLAPLPNLCEIGERHAAAIILDEAHGTGVFGDHGRGVAELLGVEDRIAVRVGTLSKAVGTLGGFVTGSRSLVEFLWNKARTQIYSTSLPPAVCAAATAAIQIIRTDRSRRDALRQLCLTMREQLQCAGVSTVAGSVGPIVPIILNEPMAAVEVAERLFADGFLVGAIRPPTVPRGTSRLRVTLHAGTPQEIVDKLVVSIAKAIAEVTRT